MAYRRLGFNVDHVATVRQARRAASPDPLLAALLGEQAGADQITCHPRGDWRHIQEHDVRRLRESITTLLNVEMATTPEMIGLAEALRPHRVTLVAERPGEVTTEGGLDVQGRSDEVASATARLVAAGVRVSLFIDPEPTQVAACVRLRGVDMVELNTDRYARSHVGGGDALQRELSRLAKAAEAAWAGGLEVAAGHGLDHLNLPLLVAEVPRVAEYNIGFSIVGRAVFVGLDRAVRDIVAILRA